MVCISRLAFLLFTFHWYLPCSNQKYQNTHVVSINQIADFLHFNDKTKFHIADSQQVIAMVVVGWERGFKCEDYLNYERLTDDKI